MFMKIKCFNRNKNLEKANDNGKIRIKTNDYLYILHYHD